MTQGTSTTPILALVVSAVLGFSSFAFPSDGEQRTLQAGYLDFPPFKYTDEKGNPSGPWVTMTETLAREAEYELEWIELPITRVFLGLKRGDLDIWPGVADIPQLQGHVFESVSTPLLLSLSAFHDYELPAPTSVDDLRGEHLVLIRGFTYLGWLDELISDQNTQIARAPSHLAALRMLKMGRGDYLIDYDEPAMATQRATGVDDLAQTPLIRVRGSYIVSRQTNDAETVARDFDRAYRELMQKGELVEIVVPRSP